MARQQHLGQSPGEGLDTGEINIGNKTMQQEVSLSIDMVNRLIIVHWFCHFVNRVRVLCLIDDG